MDRNDSAGDGGRAAGHTHARTAYVHGGRGRPVQVVTAGGVRLMGILVPRYDGGPSAWLLRVGASGTWLLPAMSAAVRRTGSAARLHLVLVCVHAALTGTRAGDFDVVVYGANAAGVLAGVAAARRGSRTALLCQAWPDCWAPSRRVGGLTTGGLGTTDSCHQSADEPFDLCQLAITGGLAQEFYARSAAHYGCRNCTAATGCLGCNMSLAGRQMPYNVEPSVALAVLMTMIEAERSRLTVYYEAQVHRVTKVGPQITSLRTDDGRQFNATVFIDSSYEGDLLASAGVDYTVGREPPSQYNETLNGRLQSSNNMNNFQAVVDPFVNTSQNDWRTLPGIMTEADASMAAGVPKQGDRHVQAYNFRLCMSKDPANQIPFPKPDEYHRQDYELLVRSFLVSPKSQRQVPSCNTQPIPNGKWDNNNCGPVSSDLVTADYTNKSWRNLTSWRYPLADYHTRREIWNVHRRWQQGLLWTLSHDTRLPFSVREEMSLWGLCKDEFTETSGWPPTLYVREARRMVGERVLTQMDVREGQYSDIGVASLGLAAHAEDSHNNQRFACRNSSAPPCHGDGPRSARGTSTAFTWNEGDFHGVESAHVYQLPRFICLPKAAQASNLLVVSAPSASHVAFSTFRMEPAFMVLGSSAGVWASLAAEGNASQRVDVRSVSEETLNSALVADGQVLKIPAHIAPVTPNPHSDTKAGFTCDRGFRRCLAVAHCAGSACYNSSACDSMCSALTQPQWLALKGSDGGFALQASASRGHGHRMAIKALSAKSFLKKSELRSSGLPAEMKREVAMGDVLAIEESDPTFSNGYWLVTVVGE